MRISEFAYDLPPERIAQEPAAQRDGSRLMKLDRATGEVAHLRFTDLPGLLEPGDLLVLNDTRVVPARIVAEKPAGGRAEVLLLERLDGAGTIRASALPARAGEVQQWRALVRGFPRGAPPVELTFPEGLRVVLESREPDGEQARVSLHAAAGLGAILERIGRTPLPPYIRRERDDPRAPMDRERYQTVYAASPGAVAAPTAGLHFTPRLLEAIRARGVAVETLTLHVGWGTFQPVRVDSLDEHRMHPERFEIPERLAAGVNAARRRGGRVVAVGTTVVRALEHASRAEGGLRASSGTADLFIRPGHRFSAVDGLVTNFHLPASTLLVLVCAFAGKDRTLAAYREAVARGYRFYSYGDAMVIL